MWCAVYSATPSFAVSPADNGKTYPFLLIVNDGTLFTTTVANVKIALSGGEPLPVTWLYFNGKQQGEDALLTWGVASEVNTKEYVVERSLDGMRFSAIGTAAAKGTSTQSASYSFVDADAMRQPATMLFYLLRQLDQDGSFTYSTVVTLPVKQTATTDVVLQAYPNPFAQAIHL